jgi:hypothetical protein
MSALWLVTTGMDGNYSYVKAKLYVHFTCKDNFVEPWYITMHTG